jgi:hypothetical protein
VLEHRGMQAAGELAQLLHPLGQLGAGRGHERLGRRGVAPDAGLDQLELEREGDEPLLGAVVQVGLEPAPLGVARRDEALPRRPQLGQPRLGLRAQGSVLERDPRRRADRLDQLGSSSSDAS